MDTPALISRLLAPVYLAVGLGMLINAKFYRAVLRDLKERASLVYYGGLIALAAGWLIVTFHPSLEPGYHLPITVLGWLAFAKGVILLVYPQWLVKPELPPVLYYAGALFILAIGAYFAWLGYVHAMPKNPVV